MALQRLVETYRPTLEEVSALKSEPRKITEAEIKKINYGRLTEAAKASLEEKSGVSLTEKTVWRFPISRYDCENANGRVYEKKLWDRVISEQKETFQGNVGLADHPLSSEEDGLFKNSGIVWLDMGLDEANKLVWGDGIFVGSNGRLAEEILEAGGRIGFSSSGLGELNESDNKTVRWDTYMLERPADMVLNPSQKVFGTLDMKRKPDIDLTKNVVSESTEQPSAEPLKEHIMEKKSTMTLSKIEEKKIRRELSVYLEEAANTLDPRDRITEYKEILEMCTADALKDQKELVEAKISEVEKLIESRLKDSEKIADVFGTTDVETLKEGVKKVVVDSKLFERQAKDWKAIAEGLQKKVAALTGELNVRPTTEQYKEATDANKKLHLIMKRRVELYEGKLQKASERLATESALQETMTKNLNKVTKQLIEMKSQLDKQTKLSEQYKAVITEYETKIEESRKAKQKVIQESQSTSVRPRAGNMSVYESTNDQVVTYYESLEARHGDSIQKFKEKILNCKTVFEAMREYTKALTVMNEVVIPESIAETPIAKKVMRESSVPKGKKLNLPEGWE